MKESPILFSGAMVRAILSGQKTQTRRPMMMRVCGGRRTPVPATFTREEATRTAIVPCAAGDLAWVRETFYCDDAFAGDYSDVGHVGAPRAGGVLEAEWQESLYYRADGEPILEFEEGSIWRPSIHMPRWASRITLPLVEVRVERVQDISAEDARAEGVTVPRCDCEVCSRGLAICPADATSYIEGFRDLWVATYGREAWEANPWVWVIRWEKAEVRK